MGHAYPLETVIRAFVLIMDHHSAAKASEHLENYADIQGRFPTEKIIRTWAKKGELVGVDWYKFREIADTVRMKISTDSVVRQQPKKYQQFVEDAKADLDKLQDMLYANLSQISLQRPSDVKAILEARRQLEEDAEWRIQQTEEITQVVGSILRACAEHSLDRYPSEDVKSALELLIDSVAEEFQRFLAFGGDTEHYEVATGSGSTARRLQAGSNGREEA